MQPYPLQEPPVGCRSRFNYEVATSLQLRFLGPGSYQSLVLPLHQNGAGIPEMSSQRCCDCRCETPVPPGLTSVGRCVTHFIASVEEACAQMHREMVLRGADAERQAVVARYISESAQLVARVSSDLPLSDDLKPRILSSFLCLMNLREKLDRVRSVQRQPSGSAAVASSAVAAG